MLDTTSLSLSPAALPQAPTPIALRIALAALLTVVTPALARAATAMAAPRTATPATSRSSTPGSPGSSGVTSVLGSGSASNDVPATRRSSLSLRGGAGREGYRNQILETRIGVDPEWQLALRLDLSQNNATTGSAELRGGVDWQPRDSSWGGYAWVVGRREPESVRGLGALAGASWTVSDLWDADLLTDLLIDVQVIRFTQSTTVTTAAESSGSGSSLGGRRRRELAGTTRVVSSGVVQQSFSLGVSQDLTQRLSAQAAYTFYGSQTQGSELSQAISDRPATFDGLQTVVDGIPLNAVSARLDWTCVDPLTLQAFGSITRIAPDVANYRSIRSLGGGAVWSVTSHWRLSAEGSWSGTDTGTSLGGLAYVGVRYSWR